MKTFKGLRLLPVVVAIGLAFGTQALAQTVTLTDQNSVVNINAGTQGGMNNWYVDGQDQMFQQWFWYRIGSTGPESSINTIGTATVSQSGNNYVSLLYTSVGSFSVEVQFLLTGGLAGSGTSDVAESIRINNLSNSSLDFHFYQYSDFDLAATPANDRLTFVNANAVQQSGDNQVLSETVITPSANHYQGGAYAGILSSLNDSFATTLNDTPGIGTTLTGDMTWAYQWDRNIAAGGSFLISKDKLVTAIPEPETYAMLLAGLGLMGFVARRRQRKLDGA